MMVRHQNVSLIYWLRQVSNMSLSKIILNIALKIIDILTFWIKQDRNRITFISLTQKELTSDFLLIDRALKKEAKYDIHYNLMVFEKNLMGDFKYFLNCLKQMVDLKKSALVIINDNNYVISHCKPNNTKVLQVWHACGAVKKFGNEIKRQYPIRNYDAILCNAEYWIDVYSRSFGVTEDKVFVTGMPRTDELLDEERQKKNKEAFLKKYPQCTGKKLCLYAPTFRGNIIDGFRIKSFDFKKVESMLDDDYLVLYKFHPLLKDVHVDSTKAINVNKEDLYTLFAVSDCLISDYSSILFDYSLLDKKMIAYIDDVEEYGKEIGLNVDLENEFCGAVCKDENELVSAIKTNLIDSRIKTFQSKYMRYTDGKNTQRVIQLINQLMKKV